MATYIGSGQGSDHYRLGNGEVVGTGLLPADMPTMAAAPQFSEAYPIIPEKDWPREPGKVHGGARHMFPYSWSQGQQNSCGGHGAGAAFVTAWNIGTNEPKEFSPTFIYGCCNGGVDNGSRPDELRRVLLEKGACLRSTVGPGEIFSRNYSTDDYAEAARYRIEQAPVIMTVNELVTAALRDQPVFSGIWCGGNFTPDSKGRIGPWDRTRRGGHCTAQIGGYEWMEDLGPGLWTKNSWYEPGKTGMWGVNGWCWVPIGYFAQGLADFAAVAIVSVTRDPKDAAPTPDPVTAA